MKKKIFGGIIILAVAAMAVFNINLNMNRLDASSLSLINVEAMASEIDYNVPGKNNNPKSCTLYFDASGKAYADKDGAGAGVTLRKDSGMENFCENPPSGAAATGCDPYNCHKRI